MDRESATSHWMHSVIQSGLLRDLEGAEILGELIERALEQSYGPALPEHVVAALRAELETDPRVRRLFERVLERG